MCPHAAGSRLLRGFQNPETLILVGQINVASCVNENVLALHHECLRQWAIAPCWIRWQKPSNLARIGRRCHIKDPKPAAEVAEVEPITRLLDEGIVLELVLVVRPEPSA